MKKHKINNFLELYYQNIKAIKKFQNILIYVLFELETTFIKTHKLPYQTNS